VTGTDPGVARTSTLRDAQKAFTRQRLLDGAAEAFAAKGYGATTIDDVVEVAGATRATFYLHFKGKADIVRELVAFAREESSVLYEQLMPLVRDGRRESIHAWLGSAMEYWERMRPYLAPGLEAAVMEPELQQDQDGDVEKAVAAIVAGLSDAGRLPDAGARRLHALLMFGQLEWLFRRWMRLGWEFDREQVLDALTETWMAALR
jgi:AcrR family transcriptional regulator